MFRGWGLLKFIVFGQIVDSSILPKRVIVLQQAFGVHLHNIAPLLMSLFRFLKEETISPKIFVYFFIDSDPNLTQTQIITPTVIPNLTQTQNNYNPNLNP